MSKKLLEALGLESIKFQSSAFFNELTMLYVAARESGLSESKLIDSKEVESIAKCIQHHTGLNVRISVNDSGPSVGIPMVNKNHVFIEEWMREWLDNDDIYSKMKKAKGILKGTVDLEKARVSGIYSEVESTINMPYSWFKGVMGVTPEECAAVTLHEVGHLFTYYEYMNRSVTSNQVLAALSIGYANADNFEKRKDILIAAKKALDLKQEGIEELASSTKSEIVAAVIIANLADKSRSELGVNIYDQNSWEYLADEFAARHQAGKHLITGLDKIIKAYGHMSYRGRGTYLALEAIKLSLIALGIMSLATPAAGFVSAMIILGAINFIMGDSDIVIYDEPEARMRRIKQQIIQAMKDTKLSKETIVQLNEDLKMIDSVMEHVKDKRQFFGIVGDFLIPSMRKNRSYVVMQQELEKIANNELFAKAAAFKAF